MTESQQRRPTALITGGSRGAGAATARALARRGYDVAFTYRNKAARAERVAAEIVAAGGRALPIAADITDATARDALFNQLDAWTPRLDLLVLNASGGLERDLLAANPDYPMLINRDAQIALVERARSRMRAGGTVVFVTSHWAHLFGQIDQLDAYEPIARGKHAGEIALRGRQDALAADGVRLLIVTGDLIDGTITAKLLERKSPGLKASRAGAGAIITTEQFGEAVVAAATDPTLPTGHTTVAGGSLEMLLDSKTSWH